MPSLLKTTELYLAALELSSWQAIG